MKISRQAARQFILEHQGLLRPRKVGGKEAVMAFIRKVGCVQYDPIDVVGRNADLVLQARMKGYKHQQLFDLLYKDRVLVDGWDKNMAIFPTEEWPYFHRFRERIQHFEKMKDPTVKAVAEEIRQDLKKRGPLSSTDIENDIKVDWFWASTKASRAALEHMFYIGELVVESKVGTRRIYDFASNHIEAKVLDAPDPHPLLEDYHKWYVLRRIRSVGLLWNKGSDAWLGIDKLKQGQRHKAFDQLLEEEKIVELAVEGIPEKMYIPAESLPLLQEVVAGLTYSKKATLIAPLDNLMWDRKLIKALFDFDYVWEIYKPKAQRKYGYYVLPILYGDRFVGRFEPGWDKKTKTIQILNWYWEAGVKPTKTLKKAINTCFKDFSKFYEAQTCVPFDGEGNLVVESGGQI